MSRPTPFSRLLCVLASLALAVLCVACASPKVDLYQPQPNAYGPVSYTHLTLPTKA